MFQDRAHHGDHLTFVDRRVDEGFRPVDNPETDTFVWIISHDADFVLADRAYVRLKA